MYVKPARPQSIGQLLDGTIRLTAVAFRDTWLLALFGGLSPIVASVYQFTRGGTLVAMATATGDAIYWTLYAVGMLLSVFFSAAIYLRLDAVASGAGGGGNVLVVAGSRLPLLVVLTILFVLALMLGLVLLIVPGVILAVSLMLATPVLLLEGKGPIASLLTSHRLVWGTWWRTAAILGVGGVIVVVMYLTVGFIAGAVAALLAGGEPMLAGLISLAIVQTLVGILMLPFFAALLLNVYWDVQLRKEGGDLAARARAA